MYDYYKYQKQLLNVKFECYGRGLLLKTNISEMLISAVSCLKYRSISQKLCIRISALKSE
jgi:hypothetical protein